MRFPRLLGLAVALGLGAAGAAGGGAVLAAPALAVARPAPAFDGERTYCKQWCSHRVCNPQGECYRVYYCCG